MGFKSVLIIILFLFVNIVVIVEYRDLVSIFLKVLRVVPVLGQSRLAGEARFRDLADRLSASEADPDVQIEWKQGQAKQ